MVTNEEVMYPERMNEKRGRSPCTGGLEYGDTVQYISVGHSERGSNPSIWEIQ